MLNCCYILWSLPLSSCMQLLTCSPDACRCIQLNFFSSAATSVNLQLLDTAQRRSTLACGAEGSVCQLSRLQSDAVYGLVMVNNNSSPVLVAVATISCTALESSLPSSRTAAGLTLAGSTPASGRRLLAPLGGILSAIGSTIPKAGKQLGKTALDAGTSAALQQIPSVLTPSSVPTTSYSPVQVTSAPSSSSSSYSPYTSAGLVPYQGASSAQISSVNCYYGYGCYSG